MLTSCHGVQLVARAQSPLLRPRSAGRAAARQRQAEVAAAQRRQAAEKPATAAGPQPDEAADEAKLAAENKKLASTLTGLEKSILQMDARLAAEAAALPVAILGGDAVAPPQPSPGACPGSEPARLAISACACAAGTPDRPRAIGGRHQQQLAEGSMLMAAAHNLLLQVPAAATRGNARSHALMRGVRHSRAQRGRLANLVWTTATGCARQPRTPSGCRYHRRRRRRRRRWRATRIRPPLDCM
jgi:hypothetical protein